MNLVRCAAAARGTTLTVICGQWPHTHTHGLAIPLVFPCPHLHACMWHATIDMSPVYPTGLPRYAVRGFSASRFLIAAGVAAPAPNGCMHWSSAFRIRSHLVLRLRPPSSPSRRPAPVPPRGFAHAMRPRLQKGEGWSGRKAVMSAISNRPHHVDKYSEDVAIRNSPSLGRNCCCCCLPCNMAE